MPPLLNAVVGACVERAHAIIGITARAADCPAVRVPHGHIAVYFDPGIAGSVKAQRITAAVRFYIHIAVQDGFDTVAHRSAVGMHALGPAACIVHVDDDFICGDLELIPLMMQTFAVSCQCECTASSIHDDVLMRLDRRALSGRHMDGGILRKDICRLAVLSFEDAAVHIRRIRRFIARDRRSEVRRRLLVARVVPFDIAAFTRCLVKCHVPNLLCGARRRHAVGNLHESLQVALAAVGCFIIFIG